MSNLEGPPANPITENPVNNFAWRNWLLNLYNKVNTTESGSGIPSTPTTGNYAVTNLYVDSATGRLVVEYDDTPA